MMRGVTADLKLTRKGHLRRYCSEPANTVRERVSVIRLARLSSGIAE